MVSKTNNSMPEKGTKDAFAKFFEDPSRESLRQLLTEHLGESREVDFKQQWLPKNELAKKLLGFANSGQGCLIFGVAEKEDKLLSPIGLDKFEDKADVENKLRKFLPSSLMDQIKTWDFSYETAEYEKIKGKKFQAIIVDYRPEYVPYMPLKGTTDLKSTAIYCRRDGLTIEATYDELQKIINNRVATGHSTKDEMHLKKHLEQLRVLYDEIPRGLSHRLMGNASLFGEAKDKTGETYQSFVTRMIEAKKSVISSEIGAGIDIKAPLQKMGLK